MTEHTHVGFSVGHRIMDMEGIRPMSDTLRTRIAAVLGANSHMSRELQDHLADAVIAELGLRREDLGGFRVPGYGHRGYRYVTDWTADD